MLHLPRRRIGELVQLPRHRIVVNEIPRAPQSVPFPFRLLS
jgi:hypothetical protein